MHSSSQIIINTHTQFMYLSFIKIKHYILNYYHYYPNLRSFAWNKVIAILSCSVNVIIKTTVPHFHIHYNIEKI